VGCGLKDAGAITGELIVKNFIALYAALQQWLASNEPEICLCSADSR
jgi:hypothetical protein